MKLVEFQVTNYRSIKDSGPITIDDRTVLVGRNESGKSNLLRALQSLNPPGGIQEVDFTRDFPLDLREDEFDEKTAFLRTKGELAPEEVEAVEGLHDRAKGIQTVRISRDYDGMIYVGMDGLEALKLDAEGIKQWAAKVPKSMAASLAGKSDDVSTRANTAWSACSAALMQNHGKPKAWSTAAAPALQAFRNEVKRLGLELGQSAEEAVSQLEEESGRVADDEKAAGEARDWVRQQLPLFVYLDEFPELDGHQDMDEFINRRDQGNRKEAHGNFERLCKVAGLEPSEIWSHKDKDADLRSRLTNRASAQVTKTIRGLWKDRPLKVKFTVDGRFFDTRVSDQEAFYDVDVNLNERSRGFRWFFSFYITFAADTMGGDKDKAILLLDEPGLYLHATSQGHLVSHLWNDYANQILYTTHSPFMVPTDHLETIRTVLRDAENGTHVNNDPVGDAQTLFPLQSALGYSLAQSLFIGPNNLVVEGVTDFWYLDVISERLHESKRTGLRKALVITPAGGAQRVPAMVSFLAAQNLNVYVLLDQEPEGDNAKRELLRQKLLSDKRIIQAGAALGNRAADVEDLLDPATYEALVKESYKQELQGKTLQLNSSIPRIVKRYEDAFRAVGLEFNKTRPAKLFLRLAAQDAGKWITTTTEAQFEALFAAIGAAVDGSGPSKKFERVMN